MKEFLKRDDVRKAILRNGTKKLLEKYAEYKEEQKLKKMNAQQIAYFKELLSKERYPYAFKEFANKYIHIQPKAGEIGILGLNEHQEEVYQKICELWKKNNSVELVIIKGRQDGISTFVANMFSIYHLLVWERSQFFLTNVSHNRSNLFDKFKIGFDNLPPLLKKETIAGGRIGESVKFNGCKLSFHTTNEGAGHRESPTRGQTYSFLFDDEAGHREKAEDTTSLVNSPSKIRIIAGTPATGSMLEKALKEKEAQDKLDEVLFLPWHTFNEYESKDVPADWKPRETTVEYFKKLNLDNLPLEKKHWAEKQILFFAVDYFNPYAKFTQEYPSNVWCGFELTAENCFTKPYLIQMATENRNAVKSNTAVIGIDVGHTGDKTIACIRQGNYAYFIELKHNPSAESDFKYKARQLCDFLRSNRNVSVIQINIDSTGVGSGLGGVIKETLREEGLMFASSVGRAIDIQEVHFATKVKKKNTNPFNRVMVGVKEYMYFELARWLETTAVSIDGGKSEITARIQKELLSTSITTKNGEETIAQKEKIKQKLGHSPDYADALALTFYPEKQYIDISALFKK